MLAIVDEERVNWQRQELQKSEEQSPQLRVLSATTGLDLKQPNRDVDRDSDGSCSPLQVVYSQLGQRDALSCANGID